MKFLKFNYHNTFKLDQQVKRLMFNLANLILLWILSSALHAMPEGYETKLYPAAPSQQTQEEVDRKSSGCNSCHTSTDQASMHASPGVKLGCADCHGGNALVFRDKDIAANTPDYHDVMRQAHVMPKYPEKWGFDENNLVSSANPERTYTLLNKESSEFIRFMNPSDYRVVESACGACHMKEIQAAKTSLMATGAMLFGGASYNNGILPYKNYLLGEAYTQDGVPAMLKAPVEPTPEMKAKGILPALYPLPAWETVKPGDIFRVFERGAVSYTHLTLPTKA